jgi:hypothetical protein
MRSLTKVCASVVSVSGEYLSILMFVRAFNCSPDISEFYEVNNTHILGEGISGEVRVCTHKQVL